MPSFGLSSPEIGSPPSTMPFGETSIEEKNPPSSVKLSCLSPDGRTMHSLVSRNSRMVIETHSLPLKGTVDDGGWHQDGPSVIRTPLPDRVISALRHYPAIELLCVDVHGSESTGPNSLRKLPSLCLYSKKDVFVLRLGFDATSGPEEVEGSCLSVEEPFDSVLIGNATSTSIVRIRQAPQQSHGYITLCPAEAMAMLTFNSMVNEYSLTLYHGKGANLSTPLVYGVEQLEDQMERLTDFCFCQSQAFPLLSSLSVAFLKATGEVMQAAPVLFEGTVVPLETLTKTIEYIEVQIPIESNTPARSRQLRVALRYLLDCFPNENTSKNRFLTSQTQSSAFEWPAQMQGPVLLAPESDEVETFATAIEPVTAGELCGLAIAHDGYKVEFGLLSPTLFIPRFQLEQIQDTQKLDQDLRWGSIVNRVDLRDEEGEQYPVCSSIKLIRDPIMDSVIHYVTPHCIRSISTNCLKVATNNLCRKNDSSNRGMFSPPSKRKDVPIRTTGWSCLDVSNVDVPKSVVGAVVSGDVQFGHVIVTRLSDGTMFAINLTETRQIQEMEAIHESQSEQLAITSHSAASSSRELQVLHDTPPLLDVAKPIMDTIIEGLRGLGKIVGSATPVEKVTPELLAAAAAVKEQTDNEIVLPVMELHSHVYARKKEIVTMFNNQMMQLQTLKEMQQKLRDRSALIEEKLATVAENAESLAQRSASALHSATDLQPTITQAEYDYFQEIQRLNDRVEQWKDRLVRLRGQTLELEDAKENGTDGGPMAIPEETRKNLVAMIDGSESRMRNMSIRLKKTEESLQSLAATAGWNRNPHGPLGPKQ